jgi:serine protease Do
VYAELAQQYDRFAHVNRTFELVAKAVSPSVVHIVAHKRQVKEADRKPHDIEETGSGVIVRGETPGKLFVLTNNHVVANSNPDDIQIYLNDGRSIRPERIWSDSRADVAVLKLDRDDLPAARLGDSDKIAVGSWVLAIGSPFGLTHSVSQGIISGRGRHEADLEKAGVENQDFLQTDAAINPGNSGGPLVNMKGEVIGLNIAILSNGGGNEGVGFSIPINLARWIMNGLINTGRVPRGALGVRLQPDFFADRASALGLDRPKGAWVDSVDKASTAAAAGVQEGDVILRFNGIDVIDLNHLINLVSMAEIGQPAKLQIWRNRSTLKLEVMIADKDLGSGVVPPRPSRIMPKKEDGLLRRPNARDASPETLNVFGLELVTVDDTIGQRLGLPLKLTGVAITKVEPDSLLSTYFKTLDVIESINQEQIVDAAQVVSALNSRAKRDHLEVNVSHWVDGKVEKRRIRLP